MHSKPSFKRVQRCALIADGWYEWKRSAAKKQPYFFHLPDQLLYMAGIYNNNGCCIVTKKAHPNLSNIHSRQPVLLTEKEIEPWIAGSDIFESAISDSIKHYPVSTNINNSRKNNPSNLLLIK